jgi:hypothetical protein
MSFLKSLFGLGGKEAGEAAPATVSQVEHKGFLIRATPFKEAGQYQTCGVISKEVGGVLKEHKFIRAQIKSFSNFLFGNSMSGHHENRHIG